MSSKMKFKVRGMLSNVRGSSALLSITALVMSRYNRGLQPKSFDRHFIKHAQPFYLIVQLGQLGDERQRLIKMT